MIRVVLFLIAVGALALGVAWFADRPGDVVITWQGMRIETSLMVLGAALLAAMVVIALVWTLLRAIVRSPYLLARFMRHRRGVRAYEAISSGLVAVGAGNVAAAQQACRRSEPDRAARAAGAVAARASGAACQATSKPPSVRSRPWRAAPTPRRSACTGSSSRRAAATIW